MLRYRQHQKRLGTRKLFHEMQDFIVQHQFKIGRDALFILLAERSMLITKRKRRGSMTNLSFRIFHLLRFIIRFKLCKKYANKKAAINFRS